MSEISNWNCFVLLMECFCCIGLLEILRVSQQVCHISHSHTPADADNDYDDDDDLNEKIVILVWWMKFILSKPLLLQ